MQHPMQWISFVRMAITGNSLKADALRMICNSSFRESLCNRHTAQALRPAQLEQVFGARSFSPSIVIIVIIVYVWQIDNMLCAGTPILSGHPPAPHVASRALVVLQSAGHAKPRKERMVCGWRQMVCHLANIHAISPIRSQTEQLQHWTQVSGSFS